MIEKIRKYLKCPARDGINFCIRIPIPAIPPSSHSSFPPPPSTSPGPPKTIDFQPFYCTFHFISLGPAHPRAELGTWGIF